jgi:prepilin-type N-terminal cleavage/methylation domain-containing protein
MDGERGFSLLEVLCATTILVVGLAALAQLVTLSTRVNGSAKAITVSTIVAAQKMEQLLSDAVLSPSPADSLKRNTSGYCDFADKHGQSLGTGSVPPAGAVYVRRWSIDPLPADPANTFVLQVFVTGRLNVSADNTAVTRRPDEARLVSIKTREAK